MSSNTTELFGDGRHTKMSVSYRGRQITFTMRPPDYKLECLEFGTDIPEELAEVLLATPGTWVRKPGGDPREVRDLQQKAEEQRKQKAAEADTPTRESPTAGKGFQMPDESMTVTALKKAGLELGLTSKSMKDLKKGDLLDLVKGKALETYPGLEGQ